MFIMQYQVVLSFKSVEKTLSLAIQMKATEQHFPVVVLFIMLYKVVLMFESVDGILKCDHSNEATCTVLSITVLYCGAVYYAVKGRSKFKSVDKILERNH